MNGSGRITPEFEFDDSSHPRLLRFEPFYQKLRVIISRNPSSASHPGETSETTPPIQTTSPSTPTVHTTPPTSTNVVDPQFSSTSYATASSAAESTDEHFTQSFANDFVDASYRSLLKSLNLIAWYRDTKYKLQHGCPAAKDYNLANFRDHQKMHVKLEEVRVTATSDGGLSLQPNPSQRCMYPVFSIEVTPYSLAHIHFFYRRSEKNTSNATMKIHIKCMPHKYMLKCSAKSVIASVTQSPKCSKRL